MFEILITAAFLSLTNIYEFTQTQSIAILTIYIILVLPGLVTYIKGPPYIPSSNSTINNAIKLAKLKPTDTVIDLGCGDGRFLVAASPHCKKAIGYETSLLTFIVAKIKTRKYKNIQIKYKNFWKVDHSEANVIFCFLLLNLMPKFHQEIFQNLPAGTRVISNTFKLPNTQIKKQIESVLLYER